MTTRTIYLTFGPVQEFLAQARRTRDLWTGSYLLSFLAGHALNAAQAAGGQVEVILPQLAGNPLWEAITQGGPPKEPGARVGSIPHIAEIKTTGDAAEVARAAVKGWDEAWRAVANAVRDYIRPRCGWTDETATIWDRQVGSLWTASWVLDHPGALAARKTLRAFDLPDEPGEKCTCCGVREPLHAGRPERRDVRAFWQAVSEREDVGRVEVRPEGAERLCAVCAIKRFLPFRAERAFGWSVPRGFPSTTTMASLPWRLDVLTHGREGPALQQAIAAYVGALAAAGVPVPRYGDLQGFAGIDEAVAAWGPDAPAAAAFAAHNADWFYPDELRAGDRTAMLTPEQRAALLRSLAALRQAASTAQIPPPGTFYVLLMMDGDNMGKLLSAYPTQKQQISTALAGFSREVPAIVEPSTANGRLIYTGGDDVLALLPRTTALTTADTLRRAYEAAFQEHVPEAFAGSPRPTISAALVYAHIHAPLQQVVRTAHRLLDEVAKDEQTGAGRDAFAVAVWKRAGTILQFAAKWGDTQAAGVDGPMTARITNVAAGIARNDDAHAVYSRGFLYGLRDLLPVAESADGEAAELLAADYLRSRTQVTTLVERGDRQRALAQARERVEALLALRPAVGRTWDAVRFAAFLAEREE